jgi:dihydroorotase
MNKNKYGRMLFPVDILQPRQRILIKDGRVIDPVNRVDAVRYVALANGAVVSVSAEAPDGFSADRTIDAAGKWVVPGLMDMHVHLREPGREDKETIATGTQAAAAGGFTAVACMPNTNPVLDEESKIRHVIQRGERCPCRIYPVGSITKNLDGKELSPFAEMIQAGAKAVSDDGRSVPEARLMRNALNYSKSFNIPVICHCEDHNLSENGHMNESVMSTRLGIRGIASMAEEIIVARDIKIAEYTGARVHIAHVSTEGSVQIIREAKKRGVTVTAETCPHYCVFSDEDLITYDTHKKMNPPLRTPQDRAAIIAGLVDGTLDVIATDHAPHCAEEKDLEFEAAAFGVIGLETSLGAVLTSLVHTDLVDAATLVRRMSVAPNRILGLSGGSLSVGAPADVTIIDPQSEWRVEASRFYSKSRNTPFEGVTLRGYAAATILDGRVVFER